MAHQKPGNPTTLSYEEADERSRHSGDTLVLTRVVYEKQHKTNQPTRRSHGTDATNKKTGHGWPALRIPFPTPPEARHGPVASPESFPRV